MPLYLKFSNNGVNFVSLPDDIEVSSSQLKRFDESIIGPECLLKIAATSFFLITFYPFQATLYFLVYYYFYLRSKILFEKQNGLELQSILSFSNCCNWAYLFRFPNRFCCHLNLTMSLGFSDLFALFLRHDLIIICFRRFLLK